MFSKNLNHPTGFTLIELLLVISLIVLLSGVAYPVFKNNFEGLQLLSFTKRLQGLFIYLQEQAIVERKTIYLTFSQENKEYWSRINGEDNRQKTYSVPENIRIDSQEKQIAFYPDGSIDKVRINIRSSNNRTACIITEGLL